MMYIRRLFRIHFRMCLRICNRVCICVMLRIPSMCFCVCVCCYVCECVFGFLCALSEGRSQPWHSIARWRAEGSAGRNKCTARERRQELARPAACCYCEVRLCSGRAAYTHTHTHQHPMGICRSTWGNLAVCTTTMIWVYIFGYIYLCVCLVPCVL
jgi:cytochrome c oxidase subunit IV